MSVTSNLSILPNYEITICFRDVMLTFNNNQTTSPTALFNDATFYHVFEGLSTFMY